MMEKTKHNDEKKNNDGQNRTQWWKVSIMMDDGHNVGEKLIIMIKKK